MMKQAQAENIREPLAGSPPEEDLDLTLVDFHAIVEAVQNEVGAVVTVESEEDDVTARERLKWAKGEVRKGEALQALEVKPHLAAEKIVRDRYKIDFQILNGVVKNLSNGIEAWRQIRAEKARKAQLLEDQKYKKKLDKAEVKAEETGNAVKIPDRKVIDTPQKTVGGISDVVTQTFDIPTVIAKGVVLPDANLTRGNPALSQIDDCYFILNVQAIASVHKAKGAILKGTIHTTKVSQRG